MKTCRVCGEPARPKRQTCSIECSGILRRTAQQKYCVICGKPTPRVSAKSHRSFRATCSDECKRARQVELMNMRMADPEYAERVRRARTSWAQSAEARAKHSALMTALWATKEFREKMLPILALARADTPPPPPRPRLPLATAEQRRLYKKVKTPNTTQAHALRVVLGDEIRQP